MRQAIAAFTAGGIEQWFLEPSTGPRFLNLTANHGAAQAASAG